MRNDCSISLPTLFDGPSAILVDMAGLGTIFAFDEYANDFLLIGGVEMGLVDRAFGASSE
jgi:hypothetical protein